MGENGIRKCCLRDSMAPNLIVGREKVSEGTLHSFLGYKEDGRILYFETCKIDVSITG